MAVMMEMEGGGAPLAPQTNGKVDAVLVEKVVDVLLKWSGVQKQKEKAQLLEDNQLLYVVVGMKKVPDKGRTNPYSVALPHPLHQLDGNHEVCLIINDKEHAKQKLNKQMVKEQIEKEGLKIAKVIPLSKLKIDYLAFEAKWKLCGSYDMFLTDDHIFGELPKLLGKCFYKKKKHLISVDLTRAQWTRQIMAALSSTFVYVNGSTCSMVKVARVSQGREEIIENVKVVVEDMAQQIPKKWANIRSYFLNMLESVALPLYQALPDLPLKNELPGLSQPEAKQNMKLLKKNKRKARVGEGNKEKARLGEKEKADRLLKNASEDKMDVAEETLVAEKSKKRKQKDVEGQQKVPRKGAAATGA